MIAYNVFAMHRRTDLWGPDARTFRPERWEENAKHGWEYLPFNGGPRICLGRKFWPSLLRLFLWNGENYVQFV
jgi:cytochrome P450